MANRFEVHDRTAGNDCWLTPREWIERLGPFDLDPCAAPEPRPWPTAMVHYTREMDGLTRPWHGLVWLNPPYGTQTPIWLRRLAEYGKGIALVYARTDTRMFHESVFGKADAMFFIRGRLRFCKPDGQPSDPAGAPSVLIAYGDTAAARLARLDTSLGALIPTRP